MPFGSEGAAGGTGVVDADLGVGFAVDFAAIGVTEEPGGGALGVVAKVLPSFLVPSSDLRFLFTTIFFFLTTVVPVAEVPSFASLDDGVVDGFLADALGLVVELFAFGLVFFATGAGAGAGAGGGGGAIPSRDSSSIIGLGPPPSLESLTRLDCKVPSCCSVSFRKVKRVKTSLRTES